MYESQSKNPERLAKRIIWEAYQVSRTAGMGVFQAKSDVSEDQVWDNAVGSKDYAHSHNEPGRIYADYVFGRMMKLGVAWGEDWVEVTTTSLNPEYQSWCTTYPTVQALVSKALEVLGG